MNPQKKMNITLSLRKEGEFCQGDILIVFRTIDNIYLIRIKRNSGKQTKAELDTFSQYSY
jgi:hypothetical protein